MAMFGELARNGTNLGGTATLGGIGEIGLGYVENVHASTGLVANGPWVVTA